MSQWYQELFQRTALKYDEESFTQGTLREVDFIEKEIDFNQAYKILDLGCGTGRHAIELTKRGYKVVGVDLSSEMLAVAKRKASEAGVKVDFRIGDARDLDFKKKFDLVIMLCEGAFPLMETDEMNFQILGNATKALRKKGKLIFTTLNGLFPLFHSVKDFINDKSAGSSSYQHTFDLMSFRDYSLYKTFDNHGEPFEVKCNERYYVPSEIHWLLKTLKYIKIDIFSCPLGEWSRETALTHNDFEMLVIAQKGTDEN
jgi:2-polyprenyl-3-methyl-5-hydroxy-6-metoxy-1,4-benzoquinol methylase